MPLYLVKFSMTAEAWAKLIKEPEDRRQTVGPLLQSNGGKLLGLWYAFGDQDGYVLAEALTPPRWRAFWSPWGPVARSVRCRPRCC